MQRSMRFRFCTVLWCLCAALMIAGCAKSKAGDSAAGLPGADKSKRVAITVEVFDRGTDGGRSDPTNNNWTKWIQEKLLKDENIDVSFVRVSRWDEVVALNNMMAAGNPPDVALSYSGDLIANYRDLGGLVDMAPYIDSLMPDLKEFLGPDPTLPGRDLIRRSQDARTGRIVAIPARRTNVAFQGTFIRKDWLDKLGLPIPTTREEYYNALKAFKEKDPGNVGSRNVIPFTMGNAVRYDAGTLLGSFIDPTISDKDRWINMVVDRPFLLPGYKEGVRFLNRLYNDGLVDRDFPLPLASHNAEALIKSGIVGSYIINWDHPYRDSPGILRDLQANVPGAMLVPCDPFVNAEGKTYKELYDPAGVNFFVPAASKYPGAAMRYVNWLSREENRLFLQIGPEGITHELVDGIPRAKAATGLWIQNSPQNIDYTYTVNGLYLGDEEKTMRGLALSYNFPPELIISSLEMALKDGKPLPVIPVDLAAAGPYTQTLIDKGNVLLAESVTCSPAAFDKKWDAGIADWIASGAQVIIDERREKYIAP
ncbi:hypothetical protein AGMMS49991_02900 [Spirochaetia bacterium]|nr:hypothetical protein AGMMS49991_02900 [Spirochaetia bacterium]